MPQTASIDWTSLEHAHGPATDVPELLAKIAKAKPKAVLELADRLAHQGWCSHEVARVTVPLLLELTPTLGGPTLAAVLVLLADLACGGSHEHFMGTGVARAGDRTLIEQPDVAAIRQAIEHELRTNLDTRAWLGHRSAPVRSAAALLFATLGPDGDTAMALTNHLARERELVVRVDSRIALAWLSTPDDAAPSLDATDPHERAAAWIATALGGRFDDEVIAGLAGALGLAALAGSVWARGDLDRLVAEVLRRQAHRHDRPDALLGVFDQLDDLDRGRFGGTLIKLLFGGSLAKLGRGKAIAPPPLDQLDVEQRAVLERLSEFDSGWGASDQGHFLGKLGLPNSPPRMREYLGHPRPMDLLDRPLSFGRHEGSIRAVLAEVCTEDRRTAAPQIADAIAQTCSSAELPDVAELANQVDVDWPWTLHAVVLHLVCDRSTQLLASARAKLADYAMHGPPQWWNTRDQHCIGTYMPILLWIAVKTADPTATLPSGLTLDPIASELLLDNLEQMTDRSAGWVRDGLG